MRSRSPLEIVGVLVLLVAAVTWGAPSGAEEAEEKGLAIAREADLRDQGFGDYSSELEMILRDRRGQESRRTMRVRVLETADDGDKTLIIFDHPKDVQGTALLTLSHRTGPDDQWLYLPALKRVKRISSSNRSGPFMGSEFAFEDLASQDVEKYTYRFLREDEIDGDRVFVIERVPVDSASGYLRQEAWLDQAEYRVRKIDYFDRKGTILKTLVQRVFQRYLNKHWRPDLMQMTNHQTGKTTELNWRKTSFRVGLEDRDFDRTSLARAR